MTVPSTHDVLIVLDGMSEQARRSAFGSVAPFPSHSCCHTDDYTTKPIVLCAATATHCFEDPKGQSFKVCAGHLAHAQNLATLAEVALTR
jgi:hypothetical protein